MNENRVPKGESLSLPDGWRWITLGEIISFIKNGIVAEQNFDGNGFPVTRIETISNGVIEPEKVGWVNLRVEDFEEFKLCEGDILFSHINSVEKLGNCAIYEGIPENLYHGMNLLRIKVNDDLLDPRFLLHWFRSDWCKSFFVTNARRAIGQASLNQKDLKQLLILLPALPEQKRIASKLQELMQEVERARTACEKQFDAAKTLPAAYLREVFESEEVKKWERRRLGEVCEFIDSMRIPVNDAERQKRIAGKKKSDLYPYYGANGQIGWIDDYLFNEDLVLLAEDGGFFGSFEKPIAYRVSGKCWVNNHAHVLRAKRDLIDVDWLYFTLTIRPDIIQFASGTTRLKINQEQAALIPITLPPLPEQHLIATELKEKMAESDRLLRSIEKQLETINALPEIILRKAFRGEL
jgi:type I restriction enzyme, S subunit